VFNVQFLAVCGSFFKARHDTSRAPF